MGKLTRGDRNIAWIEEHCRVPEGMYVAQDLILRDWQREIVKGIYDTPTRRAIVSVGRKNAKALALDTPLPTADGWRVIGDIEPGDHVFDSSGHLCLVLAVSEIFQNKPCYRVGFSDGSEVVASSDHLWTTTHSFRPWAKPRVNGSGNGGRWRTETVTTKQIANSLSRGSLSENNHKLRCAAALELPSVDLPVPPYTLGAWLGDGNSSSAVITAGDRDIDDLRQSIEGEGVSVRIRRNPDRAASLILSDGDRSYVARNSCLQAKLRRIGVLGNKHIPEIYHGAGTKQRWALLQGLMDTDGTVNRCAGRTTARASYTGTNEDLCRGVWRLARSLGLKASFRESEAKLYGRVIGGTFVVSFSAMSSEPVFRLSRKQLLLPGFLSPRSRTVAITCCDLVESVPTKCLMVDADDQQFLVSHGCIPTHNTALSAFLLLLHLVGPEAQARQNSELYSTAMSREQAARVFQLAAKVVRLSPSLSEHIIIRDTAKQLLCHELGTTYQALSADASTAFGFSPALIIHDELGQVRGPRHTLYEAMETATAAQKDPLSIVISTQAPTEADLLSILIDDIRDKQPPKHKLFIWEADTEADPFDELTIKQANPAFGDFQDADEVLAMAEAARRMPSREAEFRNLVLNQRVEASSPFVTKSVWDANAQKPQMSGGIYGGLDLSETNDLTALVLASPNRGKIDVEAVFWLPEEGIEERARQDRVPYNVWAKKGYIKLTPGRSVEYEYVAKFIVDLFHRRDVRKISFDRWNMKHLRPWLVKAGLSEAVIEARFEDFGQGYVSMSPALRNLESLLLNEKIRHGDHPVLTMCAANAVVKRDEAGNRKLDKRRSRGRIDGMVGLAMATAIASEDTHQGHALPVSEDSILESLNA